MSLGNNSERRRNSGITGLILVAVVTAVVVGITVYLWQSVTREEPVVHVDDDMETVAFFKVYGPDEQAMEVETNFHVAVPEDLPLVERVSILADRMSRFRFDYHPINVVRIDERDNERIAIIDLTEPDYPNVFTWAQGYFQGSTGGGFTTITLTHTFLQLEYEGEWIDAVEFLYEGEPIQEDEWDHIGLFGTIRRQDIAPR